MKMYKHITNGLLSISIGALTSIGIVLALDNLSFSQKNTVRINLSANRNV